MRTGRLIAAVAATLGVAGGGAALAVAGAPPSHCRSVRTDRFYKLAPHGLFGATSITAAGTSCAQARPVARKYVRNPFSVDSPKHRTKKVDGWSCTWRANLHVAQQVSVTCTRSGARIRFKDTLPNG